MIGEDPVRGLVSSDNSLLYIANFHSQYVTIYAIDEGKRLPVRQGGSIRVGDGPSALAFSSSGLLLFVVDARSSDIAVVRTASRSLFTIIPTGRAPNAIAVKAFKLPEFLQAPLSPPLPGSSSPTKAVILSQAGRAPCGLRSQGTCFSDPIPATKAGCPILSALFAERVGDHEPQPAGRRVS